MLCCGVDKLEAVMTRKHFKRMAEALNESVKVCKLTKYQADALIYSIGNVLKEFNPTFDERRFWNECTK